MTMTQKQALLAYLGCYDGPLDGLWGEKSQWATIDFQRGYMDQEDVDGIFGASTESGFWRSSPPGRSRGKVLILT